MDGGALMNSYNYDVRLAQLFRERDNQEIEGPILGEVINIDPLRISTNNNQIVLGADQCYICTNILTRNANITFNGITGAGSIQSVLNIGDQLLCLPTANGQKYFIIDKVVG